MKNRDAAELLANADGMINHLVWMASVNVDSVPESLEDILDDIHIDDIPFIFGEKAKCWVTEWENWSFSDRYEMILDANLYGFIAQVFFRHYSKFTFKDGKPYSWEPRGFRTNRIIYAESTSELAEKIEVMHKKMFAEDVENFKRKNKQNEY